MFNNNSKENRAAFAGGNTLGFVLAMGLGLMARPAEAAPFAYVTNGFSSSVSVIDTATTPPSVVVTVPVGSAPGWIAVTPDGKHAYVVNNGPNNVSVIDTATNTVVATVTVGNQPFVVAVTPDGQHAYVTNGGSGNNGGTGTVSVIDTATNTVGATVAVGVGSFPFAVAVTPDGKHAYVTKSFPIGVSVIDTATNTVVGPLILLGGDPGVIAITPDGKHAYVTDQNINSVSVIETTGNTVMTTITVGVGSIATGVAFTPDGKLAYVVNGGLSTVSVIDTATNTVVGTPIKAGFGAYVVGIVPPPPGVPFLGFGSSLKIAFGAAPNTDAFQLGTSFTLSSTAPAINPLTDPVTLQIGTFAVTIPSGSFFKTGTGKFSFEGIINGVTLKAHIKQTGTLRYNFEAGAQHASLTGTQNTVYVTLAIGGGSNSNSNSGATSVTAAIFH